MAYWLCITNEENWKVIREKNIWGLLIGIRIQLRRVKSSSKLFIYCRLEKFPWRVKIKSILKLVMKICGGKQDG